MSTETITKTNRIEEVHEVVLFHLVFIFVLMSVVGLGAELIVSFLLDGRWESRAGFVIGPFSPLYGFGAVFVTLIGIPLRNRSVPEQFGAIAIACGALECFTGWFLETRFGIVAWSYADMPLNIHGWTCAFTMVVWGVVGIIWMRWGLPFALMLSEKIPQEMRTSFTVVVLVLLVADAALTLACLDSWFLREAGYPMSNPIQQFCAAYFDDDFMRGRFETMGMWTSLASR